MPSFNANQAFGPLAGSANAIQQAMGQYGQLLKGALANIFLPLTASIALASASLATFAGVIHQAAQAGREMLTARQLTGGTTGNVSFLTAIGLDPGTLAGVAAQLRATLAAGGIAGVTGRQLGSGLVLPRAVQPGLNQAELLQRVVKGLAGITDPARRFAAAVRMDAEALLPAVAFYTRHAAAVDADAKAMAAIQDEGFQTASADVMGNLDRVWKNLMQIIAAFAKPFMKPVADFLGRLADRLRDFALWVNANEKAVSQFRDGLVSLATGILMITAAIGRLIANIGNMVYNLGFKQEGETIYNAGKLLFQGANEMKNLLLGPGGLAGAVDKNTQAVDDNTAAYREGTFGGGQRTRRAVGQQVPGFMKAELFDRAVAGAAYRVGAF